MGKRVSTVVAWLHHRRPLMHAVIVLFWVLVSLLPYIFVQIPATRSSGTYMLRPLLSLDLGEVGDVLARRGRTAPPDPDIVFLGIDDASTRLDSLDPEVIKSNRVLTLMTNRWPWPREVYGALLDRLCDAGARVVVFDLLLTSRTANDPLLKTSLDRHADKVILGCNFSDQGERLALPSSTLVPQTLPLDRRTAFVNFWPDLDGVIRRARFHFPYNGAAIGEVDSQFEIDSIPARVAQVAVPGAVVPAGDELHFFRYTSPAQAFRPISVYEIFDPQSWQHNFGNGAFFKNKIVMVGPSGNFQQDQHLTPLFPMDGAQIHLQALNALLQHEFLFYTGNSLGWMIFLVGLTGLSAWVLLVTVYRAVRFCFLALGFYAVYLLFAIPLFSHGIILAVAAPLGAFFASTLMGLSTQYILEQIERARTRTFFERYVSPEVVGEILDNPVLYNESLVGRRRAVTVLFSDLRGFTTMTEKADSEELVLELNEYLEEMTKALFEHKGILDKFTGDGVMAVWGSFKPDPIVDTQNAVRAALGMGRALAALNVIRQARGQTRFGMGIGIHHGEAVVGDIGSERAKNFTVIGDTVNLTARLEGVTKEYGVELVISDAVQKWIEPYFYVQSLGFTVVKGRQTPVDLYTVIGEKGQALPADRLAYLEQFEKAMAAYLEHDFVTAREGFAAGAKLVGHDPLSEVFIERCREFEAAPPPEDWDGAHRMTRK